MKMLQILCSDEKWEDLCEVGVLTDIKDSNGEFLRTGDIVKILDVKFYAAINQTRPCGEAIVQFDQYGKFIKNNKFYVDGWFRIDWEAEDSPYVLEKQNKVFRKNKRTRIVDLGE